MAKYTESFGAFGAKASTFTNNSTFEIKLIAANQSKTATVCVYDGFSYIEIDGETLFEISNVSSFKIDNGYYYHKSRPNVGVSIDLIEKLMQYYPTGTYLM